MRLIASLLLFSATLLAAVPGHAQLTLRGDYAAARGITEVSALYARQTQTSVVVTPFSTNAGIQGVIDGQIDVAASARPALPSRPQEQELVFWPVAWDAIVFIVHPSNPVRDLSMAQVRDIYQGKLSRWSEVGGHAGPIDLYSVMGPYDGLETSMRQLLFGNPGYNAKISRLFLNQHQIEVGVQMDPDSIGITTLAGIHQQKVRALSIEGVTADKDSVAAGRYLLTVPLFMVYRADNPKAAEITRFAEFLRTPVAENVISGKRLVPHREDEAFRNLQGQRLAQLWAALGGQPVDNSAVRFRPVEGAARTAAEATAAAAARSHDGVATSPMLPATAAARPASAATGTTAAMPAAQAATNAAAAQAATATAVSPAMPSPDTPAVATDSAAILENATAVAATGPAAAVVADAVVADAEVSAGAGTEATTTTETAADADVDPVQPEPEPELKAECRKTLFSRKC